MGCEALKPFTADKLPLNPDTKAQQIKLQDSAFKDSRIQLINATPSESSILSKAISQNTSHGVL